MLTCKQLQYIMLDEAKVVHGREFMPYVPPNLTDKIADAVVSSGQAKTKEDALRMIADDRTSLSTNDAYTSLVQRELENYDKTLDEAVLASDNLVKAYNAMIEGKFDEAVKTVTKKIENESMFDKTMVSAVEVAAGTYQQMIELAEFSDAEKRELKDAVIKGSFYTSDDPNKIRHVIKLRINYNNAIIKIFQNMLKANYTILGISKDEALLLSQRLGSSNEEERKTSITTMKKLISDNKSKFDRGDGIIDMREIGGGVIYGTALETGLDKFTSLDRMLQTAVRYDAIIFGHGSSSVKEAQELEAEIQKKHSDFEKRQKEVMEELSSSMEDLDAYARKLKKVLANPKYKNTARFTKTKTEQMNEQIDSSIATVKHIRNRLNQQYSHVNKLYDTIIAVSVNDPNYYKKVSEIRKNIDRINARIDKTEAVVKKMQENVKKMIDEYNKIKDTEEAEDNIVERALKSRAPAELVAAAEQLDNEEREMEKELKDTIDKVRKIMAVAKPEDYVWTIQPVKTMSHGTFTDMNDLVRAVIKEGAKKINIISCNPGHHELDPDIKKTPGVIINHAMNSLLAENVLSPACDASYSMDDPIDEAEYALFSAERHMIEICNECGIDYYSDAYLDESIDQMISLNSTLMEGAASNIWSGIVSLVKKTLGAIVAIFKKLLEFFRSIIEKIKGFFGKIFGKESKIEKPLRKKFDTKFIIVESANMKAVTINNWDDLQKASIESCNKIASKIQDVERQQTECMKRLQQFAEQQERKNPSTPKNESVVSLSQLRDILYS